jgi:hypothetical protein
MVQLPNRRGMMPRRRAVVSLVVVGLALPPLVAASYGVRCVRQQCYLLQIAISMALLGVALPPYWLHLTSTSTGNAAYYDCDLLSISLQSNHQCLIGSYRSVCGVVVLSWIYVFLLSCCRSRCAHKVFVQISDEKDCA